MKMYARKTMLAIACFCLVSFQSASKAQYDELKGFGALGAMLIACYYARSMGNMFGRGLVYFGELIQTIAKMKLLGDSKKLRKAKEKFDKSLKAYHIEENQFLTDAIINKIPEALNDSEKMDVLVDIITKRYNRQYNDEYYRCCDATIPYAFGGTSLVGVGCYGLSSEVATKLGNMAMNDNEFTFYKKAIENLNVSHNDGIAKADDIKEFIDYTHNSLTNHRREMAKNLINVCIGHMCGEYGTRQEAKKLLMHKKPEEILMTFKKVAVAKTYHDHYKKQEPFVVTKQILSEPILQIVDKIKNK